MKVNINISVGAADRVVFLMVIENDADGPHKNNVCVEATSEQIAVAMPALMREIALCIESGHGGQLQ